jgi:hypothetical protein
VETQKQMPRTRGSRVMKQASPSLFGGANALWQGLPENQAAKGGVDNCAFTKFRWGLAGPSGRNPIGAGPGKTGKYNFTS